ncbi:putative DNA recombination protein [Desulforapulum autotrophicum HRM2]|uniref:DNA recombination protein n=1 Tax=Desulforapulum autotrophicum (strain ATCC 43914 / DSM 3382 / VKM B-1955 / HRM2) TaxID=177437 RepID=C0QJA5_DESAH|nr:putative DNA recombination protein [Desulforapulum autotrophicum HRM2]
MLVITRYNSSNDAGRIGGLIFFETFLSLTERADDLPNGLTVNR